MKVFVSWSGERSKGLATAFREWLPLVLHYAEPWLSEADIDAGERWGQSVAKELAAANFGIVCVTSENITSPWVLFEAGALTKSLETSRVIPLLLDLEFSDITGPLAQFQAKKLTKAGIAEVLRSLQSIAEQPIPEERERQLFEALWPELQKKLEEIPDKAPTERHVRPQHEVLEELVASVRALDARVPGPEDRDDLPIGSPRRLRGRRSRIDPILLHELGRFVGQGPEDPISILIMASMFREDLPWLYELALEAYRDLTASKMRGAALKLQRLARTLEAMLHTPLPLEGGLDFDLRSLDLFRHELQRYSERLALGGRMRPEEDST